MPWRKPLPATQNAIRRQKMQRSNFEEMYRWAKKEKNLQLYTFCRIKVAARNFSDRIGPGSSGSTYKVTNFNKKRTCVYIMLNQITDDTYSRLQQRDVTGMLLF
jgi:hypothetical protein